MVCNSPINSSIKIIKVEGYSTIDIAFSSVSFYNLIFAVVNIYYNINSSFSSVLIY